MKVTTLVTLGVGLLVGCGVPVVIVGFVGIGFLGAWRARRRALAYAQLIQHEEPLPVVPPRPAVERWAAGAWGLWSGAEDSAAWDGERARQSLQAWYGAGDADALKRVIDGLVAGQTGNAAWDQVRAIDLVRIGVAAGYLSPEECWSVVRQIASSLRGSYGSWEELGAAFEAGMNAWQDSRGITNEGERARVRRNLPHLRSVVWPAVAWAAVLH